MKLQERTTPVNNRTLLVFSNYKVDVENHNAEASIIVNQCDQIKAIYPFGAGHNLMEELRKVFRKNTKTGLDNVRITRLNLFKICLVDSNGEPESEIEMRFDSERKRINSPTKTLRLTDLTNNTVICEFTEQVTEETAYE